MKAKPHSERGCRNVCASISLIRLQRLRTHSEKLGKITSPGGLAKRFLEMVADLETAQVVPFLQLVTDDFRTLENTKPEQFSRAELGENYAV